MIINGIISHTTGKYQVTGPWKIEYWEGYSYRHGWLENNFHLNTIYNARIP
jgi:hypothetical protein